MGKGSWPSKRDADYEHAGVAIAIHKKWINNLDEVLEIRGKNIRIKLRSMQRLAAMVHESTLAAMQYEVLEPVTGTEAYSQHCGAMEEEIRRALVALPPEISNPFLELVGKVVKDIMEAAHREKLEIGLGLQPRWQTISFAERLPWEGRHREQMAEYQRTLQRNREGRAPEPKRPPGAYYIWIHEAMRSEWARRRDGKG